MKAIKELSIKVRRIPVAAEHRALYAPIRDPRQAAVIARTLLAEIDEEAFVAIPVDVRNKPLGGAVVARGGPDICPVDPRSVFRTSVLLGASAVIVAHNHPSGNCEPSREDLDITRRLIAGGALLDVDVLDHLIVTDDNVVSLRETTDLWKQEK